MCIRDRLIRAREQNLGVLGIENDVADARVVVDEERPGPGGAAVGGLVDATIAALAEERALRRDIHRIGIARVDDDFADVLGLLEAGALPGLAGIRGLVDAGAEV